MERRNHARTAVNLKAAVINDQTNTIHCQVRDVSAGGMLLQHERYANSSRFHEGDHVEVRVAIDQGDRQNIIPLPMTVRRIEENGFGAEFHEPQLDLMEQLTPHRFDEARMDPAKEGLTVVNAAASAPPDSSARSSRRRSAIQRARVQLAESEKSPKPVPDKRRSALKSSSTGNEEIIRDNRRLFYIGLVSLVVALGILLIERADNSRIDSRMSALESSTDRLTNALTLLQARTNVSNTRADEVADLNARMDSLAASFAVLETRLVQREQAPKAKVSDTISTEAGTEATLSDTQSTGAAPSSEQAMNIEQTVNISGSGTPASDQPSDGPWVINLVSLHNKNEAARFTEKARSKGIKADTIEAEVRGEKIWRIQVSGFYSRDEASAYGDTSKEKLGLRDIWVFRK